MPPPSPLSNRPGKFENYHSFPAAGGLFLGADLHGLHAGLGLGPRLAGASIACDAKRPMLEMQRDELPNIRILAAPTRYENKKGGPPGRLLSTHR
jgi:hypothetical protein